MFTVSNHFYHLTTSSLAYSRECDTRNVLILTFMVLNILQPDEVITVWIALDDMSPELGPLEYVKSSHKWGDGRVGSSSSFFQSDNGKNLLYSAAKFEGIDDPERSLEIASTAGMRAGGLSIHNGKTWHGSGRNCSTNRPRRGLGLHFIHGDARFTNDARKSRLWNRYIPDIDGIKEDLTKMELQDEDFPLVWKACQDCK